VLGVWVALPWLVVHRVSFERPGFARDSADGFAGAVRALLRRPAYRRLTGAFLTARIGVDVASAMMLFYFSYWLGRPQDFPLAMGAMLLAVMASLPLWLRAARRFDKRTLFAAGALWWIAIQAGMTWLGPGHPRWLAFALLGLAGIGYAVVDLMPWSMLGDVIDEDELETGERRDGLFAGGFTFVRKLGGASGVAAAGFVLEAAGFAAGRPQSESALLAIRLLTAVLPALCLAAAIAIARGYPLTRERHAEVLVSLGRVS
jgi:GPH family glycoside/pentoside/hexuronide:cation symporter